jgi:hypothetical protein
VTGHAFDLVAARVGGGHLSACECGVELLVRRGQAEERFGRGFRVRRQRTGEADWRTTWIPHREVA